VWFQKNYCHIFHIPPSFVYFGRDGDEAGLVGGEIDPAVDDDLAWSSLHKEFFSDPLALRFLYFGRLSAGVVVIIKMTVVVLVLKFI
jgi:hypothetical protein